jgi:3-phosphoglycerate kinase
MNLSTIGSTELKDKKIFLRVDLDVEDSADKNDLRLQAMAPSVKHLLDNGVSNIFLAGHRGRFEEGKEPKSTKVFLPVLEELLGEKIAFGEDIVSGIKINLLENLRSTKDEEENNPEFAKHLASLADVYVNDAFATSHRSHASIVGVSKFIPGYLGLHFEKEIEVLGKLLNDSQKPVISLISGIKEDKLNYINDFEKFSDKVLIAGRLPEYIDPDYGRENTRPEFLTNSKVVVGKLVQDREDITIHTMEMFEEEVKKAKTIILAGVMGKYEDEGHRQGTIRVFTAISNSSAFKVAGGGDTENALTMLNLKDKFDFISVGGGAMLEYLSKGTLPGIEALIH